MLDPLFVAVGLLDPADYATTKFGAFPLLECQAVIVEVETDYADQFPEAVFWCEAPTPPSLAPATSIRPRPRPEGLGK